MKSVCPSCGFTSEEADAKFCPNCGGTLQEMAVPQATSASPVISGCPKCGSMANAAGARFCQQCGSPLPSKQIPGEVYPVGTVAPVPAAVVNPVGMAAAAMPGSGAKVVGMRVKMMPIAKMTDASGEQSGSVELHTDGILFLGKKTVIIASLHVSDISKASPGAKSNLLDVQMKDGTTKSFKFMSAADWAPLINQNLK